MSNGKQKILLGLILAAVISLPGCFSIPFIGSSGPPPNFEPEKREFDRSNVFAGYDDDGNPIVEIRLIDQEVTLENGLVINTRIFTTENFEVVNIFRGLRSINYYPVERRFHRLELQYGRNDIKMKVSENLQIKGDKPVDAAFEHTGVYKLLPDTIDMLKLKFQDVDRWAKLPADTLDEWYAAKDQFFQIQERRQRRSSLVESYRRAQEDDYTKTFTQYDSVYVTTNNAYVYLEKDVTSDILYTLNAGDQVDYGVSDGVWMEIPTPDSLKQELMDLFEKRQQNAIQQRDQQRRLARSSRGGGRIIDTEIDTTLRFTGYMLDVMAQKRPDQAIAWEKNNDLKPVDVPLFAQVLTNREQARIARRDSIAKAYQDSIQAIADSIAAIAAADSAAADSAAAGAAVGIDSSAAPAAAAATAGTAPADSTGADSTAAAQQEATSAAPADTSLKGQNVRTITGPNGQTWTGAGPPPWAGGGRGDGSGPQPSQPPQDPATQDSSAAADSSAAQGGPAPNRSP